MRVLKRDSLVSWFNLQYSHFPSYLSSVVSEFSLSTPTARSLTTGGTGSSGHKHTHTQTQKWANGGKRENPIGAQRFQSRQLPPVAAVCHCRRGGGQRPYLAVFVVDAEGDGGRVEQQPGLLLIHLLPEALHPTTLALQGLLHTHTHTHTHSQT